MRFTICLLFLSFSIFSCKKSKNAISEITNTEIAFCKLAQTDIKTAFLAFADDSAVINRNGAIIKGKVAISNYFNSNVLQLIELKWQPDFVEVSQCNDLGYTYGKYTYKTINNYGDTISGKGIFHTVWKKQPNGEWKFVYD